MFKKLQIDWLVLMANLYIQQEKYPQAHSLLEAAERLAPQRTDIKKALIFTLLELGESRRCLGMIKTLVEQPFTQEEQASLLLLQSRALWQYGDHSGAQRAMDARIAMLTEQNKP